MSWYYVNVFVHVLAAFLWLGGIFFLAVVGAPVLRQVESPALRAELFRKLGRQFRWVGWICILVLLVTGVANLHFRGLLTARVWTTTSYWTTPYGRTLAAKIILVVLILAVQTVHDFVFGPAASRAAPGSPEALRLRKGAAWLARINAFLALALVWVAVHLARGG